MAEDWGPFGYLGVSKKKILSLFFFSRQRVKNCFENI
jgi:hypothetical protein